MHHCDDGIPFCLQFLVIKLDSTFDGTIKIKLRFRLRDGESVQLYHKSDIIADQKDLEKFNRTILFGGTNEESNPFHIQCF